MLYHFVNYLYSVELFCVTDSSPVPQGTRIITVKRPITIQVPNSMPYQPVASGESMVQSPPAHTANGGSSEGVESGCANETVVLGISEPQIHYECKVRSRGC